MKLINELNEREVQLGVPEKVSWHNEYKDSAWIFLGEAHVGSRRAPPSLLPCFLTFQRSRLSFLPTFTTHIYSLPLSLCKYVFLVCFLPISSLLSLPCLCL